MGLVSWVFWAAWMAAGTVFELYAVKEERRNGTLPLTRVVRDRLMRRFWPVKIAVLAFLAWLIVHFTVPLNW